MAREIDEEIMTKLEKHYTDTYNIKDYLMRRGLLEGSSTNGDELKISCPAHSDSTPSLSINLRTGKYNCFACAIGGKLLSKLVYTLEHDVYSSFIGTYANFMDRYLKSNAQARLLVGKSSVYRRVSHSLETLDLTELQGSHSFNFTSQNPTTFKMLSRKMRNRTAKEKLASIHLLQDGFTPEQIYASVCQSPTEDSTEEIDLSEFLGGD